MKYNIMIKEKIIGILRKYRKEDYLFTDFIWGTVWLTFDDKGVTFWDQTTDAAPIPLKDIDLEMLASIMIKVVGDSMEGENEAVHDLMAKTHYFSHNRIIDIVEYLENGDVEPSELLGLIKKPWISTTYNNTVGYSVGELYLGGQEPLGLIEVDGVWGLMVRRFDLPRRNRPLAYLKKYKSMHWAKFSLITELETVSSETDGKKVILLNTVMKRRTLTYPFEENPSDWWGDTWFEFNSREEYGRIREYLAQGLGSLESPEIQSIIEMALPIGDIDFIRTIDAFVRTKEYWKGGSLNSEGWKRFNKIWEEVLEEDLPF